MAIYLSFKDCTKSDEDRRAQYQIEQGCADNTQVTPDKHHEFPQFKLKFMLLFFFCVKELNHFSKQFSQRGAPCSSATPALTNQNLQCQSQKIAMHLMQQLGEGTTFQNVANLIM